jgi:hypothetical protein
MMMSANDSAGTPPPPDRWRLADGGAIVWDVAGDGRLPHEDHVEMSGRQVSGIVRYGVDDAGRLVLLRKVVWPMLRTIPNDTHASLIHEFGLDVSPRLTVGGRALGPQRPRRIVFDGLLTIECHTEEGLQVARTLFPAVDGPALLERWELRNASPAAMTVNVAPFHEVHRTEPAKGVYGQYVLEATADVSGDIVLRPGESATIGVSFAGRRAETAARAWDVRAEETRRRALVAALRGALRLETPEPVLDREMDFAKLRTTESVYATKGGLMHGPGGGAYYAAIWANDQAEYVSPFAPFVGDAGGIEAAANCFRHFARFMKDDYAMIPSSVIAEGDDTWGGVGDRGDAAMVAYGAARFALASGDRGAAEQLWPAIQWCLEYCRRHLTPEGVIASDSDELEGRFPAGKANLCTAMLTYGALRSAADLAGELGQPAVAAEYAARADALHAAAEAYFGAEVQGFHTYRYYAGNTTLRAWICIPLTMGVMDRKDGTIAALFSPRLWTADGLATEAGKETFWDRATLYGFRGAFAAGHTEVALAYLLAYSRRRLLGDHVPYPVEAWPEGNQRHLAAESALYCRAVVEGLFGITPRGLRRFTCTPRLPAGWDRMALRSVRAFGRDFDVLVERDRTGAGGVRLTVVAGGVPVFERNGPDGQTFDVVLP